MRRASLPLLFEANRGQFRGNADFIARGHGYDILLSTDRISLALQSHSLPEAGRGIRDVINMAVINGRPEGRLRGVDELTTKTNYLIGNDPARWHLGVPTYARVEYENAYSGIDLVFYGKGQQVEYDFIVHPGADPRRIKLLITGEASAAVEVDGGLALRTHEGAIRFNAPVLYQPSPKGKQSISGHFNLLAKGTGKHEVSFIVASYDHTQPLIIDPVLDYSTYLGGGSDDWAGGVAVDNAGNSYITGTTASLNFPVTPGAAFAVHGTCNGSCYDAFVAKVNTTGAGLVYATYLGGGGDDFGNGIAIDASGDAYVTGTTNSTDFPTTVNALQKTCGGDCFYHDAFVAKLNATGSALLYSSYLGGSGEDAGSGIALLNTNAYVSGFSDSTDFPVTAGAFQTSMQGQGSSFVAQLNTTGSALKFSTFLGEVDLSDAGGAIAVDSGGYSYIAGTTLAGNFPQTPSAFHTPFLPGLPNMYLLKLDPSGSALIYSAFIGGAAPAGIAVDGSGNTYATASAGPFSPVTPGALDQACENGVLAVKLNASGSALLTSAHICPDRLWPAATALDSSQNIIFSGSTDSRYLPTTVGSYQPSIRNACCFSDGVLGKVKADGSALVYMTYFGGNKGDNTNGMAEDSSGNIYMAGATNSTNLPLKNAFQSANAGSMDTFLAKVTLPNSKISVSPALINFPTQGTGLSSFPVNVVLANLSTSSISISNAVTSGDFVVSRNSCGAVMPTGGNCIISVAFKPSSMGNRTGMLTITDGIGVQKVLLSGTGVSGPVVTFSSAYQINTAAGVTSPPFPVTITNSGNSTLVIKQISLTNGPAFNFSGWTNCYSPIAPLGSCTVDVTFNPAWGAPNSATLSLVDNGRSSPQSIGLQGNVVGNGLIFTALGLRFGKQTVGISSPQRTVTLLNGTASSVTITGIKASANFVQSHTCGATLAPAAYCNVTVTFKPTSIGIKQGTITVSNSATGNREILPLLGTGY